MFFIIYPRDLLKVLKETLAVLKVSSKATTYYYILQSRRAHLVPYLHLL